MVWICLCNFQVKLLMSMTTSEILPFKDRTRRYTNLYRINIPKLESSVNPNNSFSNLNLGFILTVEIISGLSLCRGKNSVKRFNRKFS